MLSALHGLVAWTPLGLPAFLFVITVVVFFHELGHFLVARACGVKVDVFSVGFGGEIVGFTDRSGTRWKISWLPIGGYVRFAGDANAASVPDRAEAARAPVAEREGMLAFKPLYQRAAVAAAGPVANFILAIVIFTALFLYSGYIVVAPVIGSVLPGGAAAAAGIKPGDRVTGIDGEAISDFQQLPEIISVSGGQSLTMTLDRGGRPVTVTLTPRRMAIRDMFGNREDSYVIGVQAPREPQITTEHYGPAGAFAAACGQTWTIVKTTLAGIWQMIRGYASADQFQGPLGIAKITRQVAAFGFLALVNLAAVLSVSIGLANLFPIPLLDGGHLLYYGCEAVLGRPLGERVQDLGFRLGLVLVLGVMILATWNDLVRLNLF